MAAKENCVWKFEDPHVVAGIVQVHFWLSANPVIPAAKRNEFIAVQTGECHARARAPPQPGRTGGRGHCHGDVCLAAVCRARDSGLTSSSSFISFPSSSLVRKSFLSFALPPTQHLTTPGRS